MPTPLTDADKVLRNDVGKRMADALEAIAEGSGGSAKIEEMTQAEYDALTPAQKADGTLRAISDGETKIEDIDNVNITTSDNGKLLGVSVSGSDISVSAVETTAADIPYSAGVSVADKLATIQTITVKDYRVTLGTTLWNGVYWAEQNITSDVSAYGNPISATISELLDTGSTRINRPTFAQLMTSGADQIIVRAYSPQASNAGGFDAVIRVVYANVSILA